MKKIRAKGRSLTYSQLGVDRKSRQKSRHDIQSVLSEEAVGYQFGKIVKLPFGNLFPSLDSSRSFFDMQIEGVGTKTLLAELSGNYTTIGIDGVAMAVNDVIRSGANPILVSDAIHISKSNPRIVNSIISGVRAAVKEAGCTLSSGETGDVSELLHERLEKGSPPFDLFVSCLGIVRKENIITGNISPGDRIIGLESSGVHSNGLTLARRILLKRWGGKYEPFESHDILGRSIIEELMKPTRIYAKEIMKLNDLLEIKAAVHITGDGFSKFRRLLHWQSRSNKSSLGVKIKLSRKPAIFRLILDTAEESGTKISIAEMFSTFNMGYGFALIMSPKDVPKGLDCLNNLCPAEDIGFVTTDGKISIQSNFSERAVLL